MATRRTPTRRRRPSRRPSRRRVGVLRRLQQALARRRKRRAAVASKAKVRRGRGRADDLLQPEAARPTLFDRVQAWAHARLAHAQDDRVSEGELEGYRHRNRLRRFDRRHTFTCGAHTPPLTFASAADLNQHFTQAHDGPVRHARGTTASSAPVRRPIAPSPRRRASKQPQPQPQPVSQDPRIDYPPRPEPVDLTRHTPKPRPRPKRSERFTDQQVVVATELVVASQFGSVSMLARKMRLGLSEAEALMDELENLGVVGPREGNRAREILVPAHEVDAALDWLRGGMNGPPPWNQDRTREYRPRPPEPEADEAAPPPPPRRPPPRQQQPPPRRPPPRPEPEDEGRAKFPDGTVIVDGEVVDDPTGQDEATPPQRPAAAALPPGGRRRPRTVEEAAELDTTAQLFEFHTDRTGQEAIEHMGAGDGMTTLGDIGSMPIQTVSQIREALTAMEKIGLAIEEAIIGFTQNARTSEQAPIKQHVLNQMKPAEEAGQAIARAMIATLSAFDEEYGEDIAEAREGERMDNTALTH